VNPQAVRTVEEAVLRSTTIKSALMCLMLLLAAIPAVFFAFAPDSGLMGMTPQRLARLTAAAPLVLVVLLAGATAEFAAFVILRRTGRSGALLPGWMPPLQTMLEALLPTALLFAALRVIGLADAFAGAIPWLFFPILILSALNLSFGSSLAAGLVGAVGFLAVAELGLSQDAGDGSLLGVRHPYYVKASFLAATGALTGLVALSLRRRLLAAVTNAQERDRAIGIFGQHVSPEVARRLLDQPMAEAGEQRHVCVLFLDIRNFSVFAAAHSAPEVMAYLNSLFSRLIDVVNDHHGIVNKFLGDGFMAVFGAPIDDSEPSANATRCALALLDATDQLSAGGLIPPTRLGIGLHCGASVTGNVGAETRKEYAIIGDTVNIAARIEQATKQQAAQLLVSDSVWRELPAGAFAGEDLGMVELKGQPQPLRLHRLR
jgi:adenylate cyclase